MDKHDELCEKADVGSLCDCHCAGAKHAIKHTKGGVPGAGAVSKAAQKAAHADGRASVINNRAQPKEGSRVSPDAPKTFKEADPIKVDASKGPVSRAAFDAAKTKTKGKAGGPVRDTTDYTDKVKPTGPYKSVLDDTKNTFDGTGAEIVGAHNTKVGDRVTHKSRGVGTVQKVGRNGGPHTVKFDNTGKAEPQLGISMVHGEHGAQVPQPALGPGSDLSTMSPQQLRKALDDLDAKVGPQGGLTGPQADVRQKLRRELDRRDNAGGGKPDPIKVDASKGPVSRAAFDAAKTKTKAGGPVRDTTDYTDRVKPTGPYKSVLDNTKEKFDGTGAEIVGAHNTKVGDRVTHLNRGVGTVESVGRNGGSYKVKFDNTGKVEPQLGISMVHGEHGDKVPVGALGPGSDLTHLSPQQLQKALDDIDAKVGPQRGLFSVQADLRQKLRRELDRRDNAAGGKPDPIKVDASKGPVSRAAFDAAKTKTGKEAAERYLDGSGSRSDLSAALPGSGPDRDNAIRTLTRAAQDGNGGWGASDPERAKRARQALRELGVDIPGGGLPGPGVTGGGKGGADAARRDLMAVTSRRRNGDAVTETRDKPAGGPTGTPGGPGPGSRVTHPEHGPGTVRKLQTRAGSDTPNGWAAVQYDRSGETRSTKLADLSHTGPAGTPGHPAPASVSTGNATAGPDLKRGQLVNHDGQVQEVVHTSPLPGGRTRVYTKTGTFDVANDKPLEHAGAGGNRDKSERVQTRQGDGSVSDTAKPSSGGYTPEQARQRDQARDSQLNHSQGRRARVDQFAGISKDYFDKMPQAEQDRALADLRRIADSGDVRSVRDQYGIATKVDQAHVGRAKELLRRFTTAPKAPEPAKAPVADRFDAEVKAGRVYLGGGTIDAFLKGLGREELVALAEAKGWSSAKEAKTWKLAYLRKAVAQDVYDAVRKR